MLSLKLLPILVVTLILSASVGYYLNLHHIAILYFFSKKYDFYPFDVATNRKNDSNVATNVNYHVNFKG